MRGNDVSRRSERSGLTIAQAAGVLINERTVARRCERQSHREDAAMRIERIRTVKGENNYHRKPVLVATVHLEELTCKETHEVTGFMNQLLTLLPGINQHHCTNGMAGGATERKAARIGFGHIAARVALELATLAGIP